MRQRGLAAAVALQQRRAEAQEAEVGLFGLRRGQAAERLAIEQRLRIGGQVARKGRDLGVAVKDLATREAMVARGREKLPSILGTPAPGESANGEIFDGKTEIATFPGDLPADPETLFDGAFRGLSSASAETSDFRFLRFRPPPLERDGKDEPALPHIRLDRALQFLIGDRLQ